MATIQGTKNSFNSMITIERSKLRTSATEVYEKYLVKGNYRDAAKIAKEFGLGEEIIIKTEELIKLKNLIRNKL